MPPTPLPHLGVAYASYLAVKVFIKLCFEVVS